MLQICSNGRSEKVNKRLWRGNKRMWFLINLKEEQQGDLVNPSFICSLGPFICLLHNVVFGTGWMCARVRVCALYGLPPNEMSTDLTAPRKELQHFPAFCRFYCSLSSLLLLSHLFQASFAPSLALKITRGWGNNWVCAITTGIMRESRSLPRPLPPLLCRRADKLSLSPALCSPEDGRGILSRPRNVAAFLAHTCTMKRAGMLIIDI